MFRGLFSNWFYRRLRRIIWKLFSLGSTFLPFVCIKFHYLENISPRTFLINNKIHFNQPFLNVTDYVESLPPPIFKNLHVVTTAHDSDLLSALFQILYKQFDNIKDFLQQKFKRSDENISEIITILQLKLRNQFNVLKSILMTEQQPRRSNTHTIMVNTSSSVVDSLPI